MQKLLAVLMIFGIAIAVVGCGGETPKPPAPNTDTEFGPSGELDGLESGSDTGPSGAIPPVSTPADPAAAGEQPAAEGEAAATDGPSLPDAEK